MSSGNLISDQSLRVGLYSYSMFFELTDDALLWTPTSVAVALTLGRFHIRRKYSYFYWDDLSNGLAVLCLIIYSVFADLEVVNDLDTALYWQIGLAANMLLWTILYLVKASFLAFCWLIFQISQKFRRV